MSQIFDLIHSFASECRYTHLFS